MKGKKRSKMYKWKMAVLFVLFLESVYCRGSYAGEFGGFDIDIGAEGEGSAEWEELPAPDPEPPPQSPTQPENTDSNVKTENENNANEENRTDQSQINQNQINQNQINQNQTDQNQEPSGGGGWNGEEGVDRTAQDAENHTEGKDTGRDDTGRSDTGRGDTGKSNTEGKDAAGNNTVRNDTVRNHTERSNIVRNDTVNDRIKNDTAENNGAKSTSSVEDEALKENQTSNKSKEEQKSVRPKGKCIMTGLGIASAAAGSSKVSLKMKFYNSNDENADKIEKEEKINNNQIFFAHKKTVQKNEFPAIKIQNINSSLKDSSKEKNFKKQPDITILSLRLNGKEVSWHQEGNLLILEQRIREKKNCVELLAVAEGSQIVSMPIWEF